MTLGGVCELNIFQLVRFYIWLGIIQVCNQCKCCNSLGHLHKSWLQENIQTTGEASYAKHEIVS